MEEPTLFDDAGTRRTAVEIAPGAVHLPGYLSLEQQRFLVDQFRRWAAGPVPAHRTKVRGHEMSVRTVCLGWHWSPYRYTREAVDVNGAVVPPMPDWLVRAGRSAVEAAYGTAGGPHLADGEYRPDTALLNFYDSAAKMGMHQDKDEHSLAPIVSFSVGDACVFRFGNTETRTKPYTDVRLESGDAFVFGGASRLAYHGVPRIHSGTAPAGCGLEAGRLNYTLRDTGLG